MKKEPKIIHVLSNGARVESIKGHVVPAGNPIYNVMIEQCRGKSKGEKWQLSG